MAFSLPSWKYFSTPAPNVAATPLKLATLTKKQKKSKRNIAILKGFLFFSLVFAGLLSAGLSYYFIRKYQTDRSEQQFVMTVDDHFRSLQYVLHIQFHLNLQLAMIMGMHCSKSSNWPNCLMTSKEYSTRTHSLLAMSEVNQFGVTILVKPDERISFENYSKHYYETDGGYTNTSVVTDPFLGIYDLALSPNSTHLRSPDHTNPNISKYDLLVPLVLLTGDRTTAPYLSNTHAESSPFLLRAIDQILDCVNATESSSPGNLGYQIREGCTTNVDLISLTEGYSSMLLTPILPGDDPSSKDVVGFTQGYFSWKSVLSVSTYQDYDFSCTIFPPTTTATATGASPGDTEPQSHSYFLKNGAATEIDKIDHGYRPQSVKKTFRMNTYSTIDEEYTIIYHSHSSAPSRLFAIVTALCCLGMTVIISFIFSSFSTLIKRETIEANRLLDSKRTFVRFISHEIRSALPPPLLPPSPPHCLLRLSLALLCSPLTTLSHLLRLL
jgi:hypothetical protein